MIVDRDEKGRERNERLSLIIVGACFLMLSAYIGFEAISDLVKKGAPERSVPEIIVACASLVTMPLLSRAKKKVGEQLGSAAMHADARQTDFCVYLSAILLAGLLLNAALGWWWADPTAALLMVPIIAKRASMPSQVGPVVTPVSYRSRPDAFSNVRLPAARGFSMRAMTSGPTALAKHSSACVPATMRRVLSMSCHELPCFNARLTMLSAQGSQPPTITIAIGIRSLRRASEACCKGSD
jgi:hypothetical protein